MSLHYVYFVCGVLWMQQAVLGQLYLRPLIHMSVPYVFWHHFPITSTIMRKCTQFSLAKIATGTRKTVDSKKKTARKSGAKEVFCVFRWYQLDTDISSATFLWTASFQHLFRDHGGCFYNYFTFGSYRNLHNDITVNFTVSGILTIHLKLLLLFEVL